MPSSPLLISNRTAYFRKAICTPTFTSESVLTSDTFKFAELWLRRHCKEGLPYWKQAKSYYEASKILGVEASPLTNYYCFLNATKALLTVKQVQFVEAHGVSGKFDPVAKRVLSNELVRFKGAGIVAALSAYLGEAPANKEATLTELLANLPFIHRTYTHTFKSQPDLFIPIRNPVYVRNQTTNEIYFSAEIVGRSSDNRSLKKLPEEFVIDSDFRERCVVRSKAKVDWYRKGASKAAKEGSATALNDLHKQLRMLVTYIAAPTPLWYIKKRQESSKFLRRYGMTTIMAIMHRLSELSRYDPKGLGRHLDGDANWLLNEFVELAPDQFLDELVCEMTSHEVRTPGLRP